MTELISDIRFPESTVYKMCKALTNPNLVKGTKKVSSSDQTSSLQGFHTVLNHFAPKMIHYPYPGMLCRLVFIKPNVAFFRRVLCLQYPNLIPLFLGTSMLMEMSKWGLYTRSTRMVKRLWGMLVYSPIVLQLLCPVLYKLQYFCLILSLTPYNISNCLWAFLFAGTHEMKESNYTNYTHVFIYHHVFCKYGTLQHWAVCIIQDALHITLWQKKLPVRQYDK